MGTELYTLGPKLNGDPQLHSHNIVPNVMVTESGRIVSLNQKRIAGRIHEFGAVYQAHLARNLRRIGVEVDLCNRTKMATLPVIPEDVCDEFSKRTKDARGAAKTEAAMRGMDWDTMPDQAKIDFLKGGAKASRRSKTDDLANFEAWNKHTKTKPPEHRTRKAMLAQRRARQSLRKSIFDPAHVAKFSAHWKEVRRRNGVGRPPKDKPCH